MTRKDVMKDRKINYIEIKKEQSVSQLVSQMDNNAFNARKLAGCSQIWSKACTENTRKYFTLAGALVPAGYGKLIGQMIESRMIDVIVSTSANLVHDVGQDLFDAHNLGLETIDDKELLENSKFRIYDIFTESELWLKFQKFLKDEFYVSVYKKYGSHPQPKQIFSLLGSTINKDKNCSGILVTAYCNNIDIYCPAFSDSMFGMGLELHNEHNPSMFITIDQTKDFHDLVNDMNKYDGKSILICGGGVPKNYSLQASLMNHDQKKRGFNYAIQITTAMPHDGGLSGATLNEAISWGKLKREARYQTVYVDASIALPMIAQYVLDSL